MKRWMSVLLVVCMVCACVACAAPKAAETPATAPAAAAEKAPAAEAEKPEAGEAKDASQLKFAVIVCSPDEYMSAMVQGATDAAKALGAEITPYVPTAETDVMQQTEMAEDAVASGIDVLLLCPSTTDNCLNVLERAAEQGITIIILGKPIAESFNDYVCWIGTSEDAAIREGTTVFCDKYLSTKGSPCNILYIRGRLGDETHDIRTNAFVETVESYGHTVMEVQAADADADKAAALVEDWITKYGAEGFDAIGCSTDNFVPGVAQALSQAGITDKFIMGYDGFAVGLELIKAGQMHLDIAQQPYLMGQMGVENAVAARLNGETFDKSIASPVSVIDQDNIADYIK